MHLDASTLAGEETCYPLDGTATKNVTICNCTFKNVLCGIGSHVYYSGIKQEDGDNKGLYKGEGDKEYYYKYSCIGDNINIYNNKFENVQYFAINLYSHKNINVYNNEEKTTGGRAFIHTYNTSGNIYGNTILSNVAVVVGDDNKFPNNYRNELKYSNDNNINNLKVVYDLANDANCSEVRKKSFIVKFLANSGTGTMNDLTVEYGKNTNAPKNIFEKSGYIFKGWKGHRATFYDTYYCVYNDENGNIVKKWMTESEKENYNANYCLFDNFYNIRYLVLRDLYVVELSAQWTPIDSIKVTTNPKITYIKGQNLDLTGGKITAYAASNILNSKGNRVSEEKDLSSSYVTVSGYDKTKVGQQTVTVAYNGKTATFKVNVIEDEIKNENTKYLRKINPGTKISDIPNILNNVQEYKITRKGTEIYSNTNTSIIDLARLKKMSLGN